MEILYSEADLILSKSSLNAESCLVLGIIASFPNVRVWPTSKSRIVSTLYGNNDL